MQADHNGCSHFHQSDYLSPRNLFLGLGPEAKSYRHFVAKDPKGKYHAKPLPRSSGKNPHGSSFARVGRRKPHIKQGKSFVVITK